MNKIMKTRALNQEEQKVVNGGTSMQPVPDTDSYNAESTPGYAKAFDTTEGMTPANDPGTMGMTADDSGQAMA